MKIGCMVLFHNTISPLSKSLVLRAIFDEEIIEIEVLDVSTTVIYLLNVKKEKVWQAAMDLESANIKTVYAFAPTKQEAFKIVTTHLRNNNMFNPDTNKKFPLSKGLC